MQNARFMHVHGFSQSGLSSCTSLTTPLSPQVYLGNLEIPGLSHFHTTTDQLATASGHRFQCWALCCPLRRCIRFQCPPLDHFHPLLHWPCMPRVPPRPPLHLRPCISYLALPKPSNTSWRSCQLKSRTISPRGLRLSLRLMRGRPQ
jgi:hypothetical protein